MHRGKPRTLQLFAYPEPFANYRALREHAKKVSAMEAERLNPKPKPKAAPAPNLQAPLPMQEYKAGFRDPMLGFPSSAVAIPKEYSRTTKTESWKWVFICIRIRFCRRHCLAQCPTMPHRLCMTSFICGKSLPCTRPSWGNVSVAIPSMPPKRHGMVG